MNMIVKEIQTSVCLNRVIVSIFRRLTCDSNEHIHSFAKADLAESFPSINRRFSSTGWALQRVDRKSCLVIMVIVVMMMMFVVMMVLVSLHYRDHKASRVAGRLLAVQRGLFGGGQGLFSGFGPQPLTVAVLKRVLVTQRLRLLREVVHVLTAVAL